MDSSIEASRRGAACLNLGIAVFLVVWFARYFPFAGDLTQHYLVIDEIMKHGGIRTPPPPNLGAMPFYPPGSHWLAAILGWVGGSGLVGMLVVSVVSVFACYLLIGHLLGSDSPVRMVLFLAVFGLLIFSRSLIGWEVNGNFFYPQLVGDVVYLGVLVWLSKLTRMWQQAALVLLAGAVTMWIQPLVAIHLFAAGLALMAFELIERGLANKKLAIPEVGLLAFTAAASAALIVLHPVFGLMRKISNNNGTLEFGYSHVTLVALVCGAIGAANLFRRLRGGGERVDSVLGSALIAATALFVVQQAIYLLHHEGSPYAVKKHMFIVFTLGAMNAIRLVAAWLPGSTIRHPTAALLPPVIAGIVTWSALGAFTKPVAPILNLLAYADTAAAMRLPAFTPGNTVAYDSAQPAFMNWMVTLASFEHPWDDQAGGWLIGKSMTEDKKFALVRRTSAIDRNCKARLAESAVYVVVDPACLKIYSLGDRVTFAEGGLGSNFTTTGWGVPEDWGTWTIGNSTASMVVHLPPGTKGPLTLTVTADGYLPDFHPKQVVHVAVNGQRLGTWTYAQGDTSKMRSVEIPRKLVDDGPLHIAFETVDSTTADPSKPPDGFNRVLGIAMKSMTIDIQND